MAAGKLQDSTRYYQIIYAIGNDIALFLHGTAAFLLRFLRYILFTDNGRMIFVLPVPCVEFVLHTQQISTADLCTFPGEMMENGKSFDVCCNSGL